MLKNKTYAFAGILLIFMTSSCMTSMNKEYFYSAPLFGVAYDHNHKPCNNLEISIELLNEDEGLNQYLVTRKMKALPRYPKKKMTVVSDINGRFSFPDIKRGQYSLVARRKGFVTHKEIFTFSSRSQVLYLKIKSLNLVYKELEKLMDSYHYKEAIRIISELENVQTDSVIQFFKSLILFKQNKYEESVIVLEQMITEGIHSEHTYLLLADLYQFHLSMQDKAVEYLQEYLKIKDDFEIVIRLDQLKTAKEK